MNNIVSCHPVVKLMFVLSLSKKNILYHHFYVSLTFYMFLEFLY